MVARVSQNMMLDTMQGDLRRTYQKFYEAQREAATGKQVDRASDDPTAKQILLELDSQLGSMKGYQRNSDTARKVLSTAESTLGEARNVLQRARELASQAANGATNASDREGIREEASELLDHFVGLANQKLEGEYLFAGAATDTPAVRRATGANGEPVFHFPGDAQATQYAVAEGERVAFDFALKDPDSDIRRGLEALATMVGGFEADRFSHLEATTEVADSEAPLAAGAAGLPSHQFADANGDGEKDAGTLALTFRGPDGSSARVALEGDNAFDPEQDSLRDLRDKLNQALSGVALGDTEDLSEQVEVSINNGRLAVEAERGINFSFAQDATNLKAVLGWSTGAPQMQAALKELGDALTGIADARGEMGARINRLDFVDQRRETLETDLQKLRADIGEVDVFKAYSDLAQRQQTLQAAMRSALTLQRTTILNYL
jgi:flagellar hook-associated protein 3